MKKARMIDVANHAGVSKSTVSQYLNGRFGHMSAATKEKLKNSVEVLDYVPNPIARSLKTDKTKTIGLIVRDVAGFYSSQVIRGIDDYCKSQNYNVIIYNTDFDPEAEANSLTSLKAMCVDGIIIASSGQNMALINKYIEQGTHVVQFQIEYQENTKNIVISDYFNATFQATEHLIKMGHQRICLLTQEFEGIKSREERIDGYKMALEKNNISFDPSYIQYWDRTTGFESIPSTLLGSPLSPTAFIPLHLSITVDLLKNLEQNNISIPSDVSIISFDDLPMADFFKVPITAIRQDDYKVGTESARLLMTAINGEEVKDNRIVVPCSIIERSSCTKLNTANEVERSI